MTEIKIDSLWNNGIHSVKVTDVDWDGNVWFGPRLHPIIGMTSLPIERFLATFTKGAIKPARRPLYRQPSRGDN